MTKRSGVIFREVYDRPRPVITGLFRFWCNAPWRGGVLHYQSQQRRGFGGCKRRLRLVCYSLGPRLRGVQSQRDSIFPAARPPGSVPSRCRSRELSTHRPGGEANRPNGAEHLYSGADGGWVTPASFTRLDAWWGSFKPLFRAGGNTSTRFSPGDRYCPFLSQLRWVSQADPHRPECCPLEGNPEGTSQGRFIPGAAQGQCGADRPGGLGGYPQGFPSQPRKPAPAGSDKSSSAPGGRKRKGAEGHVPRRGIAGACRLPWQHPVGKADSPGFYQKKGKKFNLSSTLWVVPCLFRQKFTLPGQKVQHKLHFWRRTGDGRKKRSEKLNLSSTFSRYGGLAPRPGARRAQAKEG